MDDGWEAVPKGILMWFFLSWLGNGVRWEQNRAASLLVVISCQLIYDLRTLIWSFLKMRFSFNFFGGLTWWVWHPTFKLGRNANA